MSDIEPIRTGRIRLGRNTGLLVQPIASDAVEPGTMAADAPAVADTPAVVGPDARSVIEAPFPESRLLRWMPVREPGEQAPENDIALVVTQEVLVDVNRHVSRTLDRELGGFLLGNLYRCPNTGRHYLAIDQSTRAHFVESSDVHLAFTLDTWAHLAEELTGKFLGKLVVGWYHSHPRMDVFLSAYDMAIHEERFDDPWTTALVIEPEKNRGGFFRWQDGKLNPREPFEFYELVERQAEGSVVDWTNHVLAGGHRPEPPDGGKRSRPYRSGSRSNRSHANSESDPDEAGEPASRHSPVVLVLAGMLLGVALCGGVWAAVDRYTAREPGESIVAPVDADPFRPVAPPVDKAAPLTTEPAPDAGVSLGPPNDPAAKPARKRSAPKPKRPRAVSNQGA